MRLSIYVFVASHENVYVWLESTLLTTMANKDEIDTANTTVSFLH